ncbi:MAG TPA: molybdopterin cofactor-binding domain-containing protein, partial [Pseudolabrys sp.]|nr:molybdopterin cofactor-binding domain-containing protein [Pseudolabrys sp.]
MTRTDFKGRREDRRFITGRGHYSNDWNLPGQVHACFRRADRAHAIIKSVDTSTAANSSGVLAVISGRDVADAGFRTVPPISPPPGRGGQKVIVPERPVLARDRVRFVGEEIAVVIAETAAAARDAADLIEVEYEDLPVVIGVERALAADAFAIHDNIPGNICFEFEYGDERRTAEAFARADGMVALRVESPRVAPTPMEVRGALVAYDAAAEVFDVYCANQGALAFRDDLAIMAGIAPKRIRVRMIDTGGAFGARTSPFPEYPVLMYAARKLGRPVKWLSTRSEDFLTDHHGRAVVLRGELAYDKNGRFLALRTEWLCDSGAYLGAAGVLTNSINGRAIGAGVYEVEALYGRHRQVMTNTAPTDAYRGAGRPEANLIVERLVDEAAARLGIDPLELRQRNLIKKEQMPYRTQ